MAKWKEIPSPEAIVRAALERAAERMQFSFGRAFPEDIRNLASNPAEVAEIIKKAGEDRG
jgi:hypothetical protein